MTDDLKPLAYTLLGLSVPCRCARCWLAWQYQLAYFGRRASGVSLTMCVQWLGLN